MHIHTILVTGATGNIGRPLVNADDDVATILGRPATTFAQWAAARRHDFAPTSTRH